MEKKKYADPNKAARNRKRLAFHKYGKSRRQWSDESLELFLKCNMKNLDGTYSMKDIDVAKELRCSLASVQYLRRKANIIHKNPKAWLKTESIIFLMKFSEERLNAMAREDLTK